MCVISSTSSYATLNALVLPVVGCVVFKENVTLYAMHLNNVGHYFPLRIHWTMKYTQHCYLLILFFPTHMVVAL